MVILGPKDGTLVTFGIPERTINSCSWLLDASEAFPTQLGGPLRVLSTFACPDFRDFNCFLLFWPFSAVLGSVLSVRCPFLAVLASFRAAPWQFPRCFSLFWPFPPVSVISAVYVRSHVFPAGFSFTLRSSRPGLLLFRDLSHFGHY